MYVAHLAHKAGRDVRDGGRWESKRIPTLVRFGYAFLPLTYFAKILFFCPDWTIGEGWLSATRQSSRSSSIYGEGSEALFIVSATSLIKE